MNSFSLLPVPAFNDNYLWLLHDGEKALVVDPGDAAPIVDTLRKLNLNLESILVTHHHADHTGGVMALHEKYGAKVFAPPWIPCLLRARWPTKGWVRVTA